MSSGGMILCIIGRYGEHYIHHLLICDFFSGIKIFLQINQ